MKIVIDSNRIIASLIKDSYSRDILFNKMFEFYYPESGLKEIEKYNDEIISKADITEEEFHLLSSMLFEQIKIAKMEDYEDELIEFENLISDKTDIPFLALAEAINADGIWTDDKHFLEQDKIRIFSTKKMVGFGC